MHQTVGAARDGTQTPARRANVHCPKPGKPQNYVLIQRLMPQLPDAGVCPWAVHMGSVSVAIIHIAYVSQLLTARETLLFTLSQDNYVGPQNLHACICLLERRQPGEFRSSSLSAQLYGWDCVQVCSFQDVF